VANQVVVGTCVPLAIAWIFEAKDRQRCAAMLQGQPERLDDGPLEFLSYAGMGFTLLLPQALCLVWIACDLCTHLVR
jgi:hypothetical protein